MYDRRFTIALLTSGFGQVWAKLGLQKSRTTLREITPLHNCAVADKGSIDEYYGDFPEVSIELCCHDVACWGNPNCTIVKLQTKDLYFTGRFYVM